MRNDEVRRNEHGDGLPAHLPSKHRIPMGFSMPHQESRRSMRPLDSATPLDTRVPRTVAEPAHASSGPDWRVGLTQDEALRRVQAEGFNEIPEELVSLPRRFLNNFWGPIPWMLEGSALMALLLGAWGTFVIILGNLGLNAIVAFWEELRASRAIASLRSRLAPQARVRRDGVWKTILARELAPGDIIHVRLGNIVPADAQLPTGASLDVDRAALTGESLPTEVVEGEIIHAGTIIRRGESDAVVIATGQRVHFATTIQLVQKTIPVGHLQRIIVRLGQYLLVIALALDLLILAVAALRRGDMLATLEYALLLAVAAVPVSMPTVLSVTMAVGAQRLARAGILIGRLSAVEELAAMDRLCVDKTGTLTQNTLTAGTPFCLPPATATQVLLDAALASETAGLDAIDRAVLSAQPPDVTRSGYQIVAFTPFDPARKRTDALVRTDDGVTFQVAKGAPQVIMDLARSSRIVRARAQVAIEQFAAHGYRSLAVARTDAKGHWRLEGIIPLYDPLRPDAKAMVAAVSALGAKVQILTGDQQAIGAEVARAVGLEGDIFDAQHLTVSDQESQQRRERLAEAAAFTQVLPEHKYRIIEDAQRCGHIVGMTGDGVNDTPALRRADVGIAVPGATEAARAASDLVLVRLGLLPLVEAIRESRRIFQRMRTYVIYRVTETMRRLFALTLAVILFDMYPVTPAMLALLATFNAAVLIALAYDETRPSAQPEKWHTRQVMAVAGVLSIAGLGEFFGLFALGDFVIGLPHEQLQTVMYVALTAAGYFTLLVARTRGPFWSLRPAPVLLITILLTLAASLVVACLGWFMAPIHWQWALLTVGYSAIWFLVYDVAKLVTYRLVNAHAEPKV